MDREQPRQASGSKDERGVAETLRAAIERTLEATSDSAASTRERATGLLDEVARRGREARGELRRRSQEVGAGLGGDRAGREQVLQRLEGIEARLAAIESALAGSGTDREQSNLKPES